MGLPGIEMRSNLLLCLAPLLCLAGWGAEPSFVRRLPFSRLAPGADHVVFYRIQHQRQYLFLCEVARRRLLAMEIDLIDVDPDSDGEDERGAPEVIHHLPIAKVSGQIQYLELSHLPDSSRLFHQLARQPGNLLKRMGPGWVVSRPTPRHLLAMCGELSGP